MVAYKRRKTSIISPNLPHESSSSNYNSIHSVALKFFHNHLIASHTLSNNSLFDIIPNMVSEDSKIFLLKVSSLEVGKQDVYSIPLDLTLTPNDFSFSFYISCWAIIHFNLFKAITDLFRGRPISFLKAYLNFFDS